MRGLEALIRMRLEGRVPSLLWIDLDIGFLPSESHMHIAADEPLHSIDLRAVQGLTVSVSGIDGARVKAICKECELSGAARVIGNISKPEDAGFKVVEVIDTDGVFTWSE